MNGKGYGMPSSHAQFVTFFAVSLTLFLLLRHNPHTPNTSTTHIATKLWERSALAILVCVVCAAVAQSRIYLNYHTPKQVLVGCAAGAVIAVGWFIFTTIMLAASFKSSFALVLLFFFLDLTFLLLFIAEMTGKAAVQTAGGSLGIVTAAIAFYAGAAGLLSPDTSYFMLPVMDLSRKD